MSRQRKQILGLKPHIKGDRPQHDLQYSNSALLLELSFGKPLYIIHCVALTGNFGSKLAIFNGKKAVGALQICWETHTIGWDTQIRQRDYIPNQPGLALHIQPPT